MSTLSVTTIDTANSTIDLTLKTGNTSGPEIVLAANGSTLFNNVSTLSIGNSTVNTVIASTGITLSEQILTGNVTPTAIAANTNDWNPGITGIYQVRTSANTDGNINYNITGLDGGVNGQVIIIQNIGVGALNLKNRSADSSSENQFALPDDIRLDGEQSIQLYYDGNDTKWKLLHSIDVPYFHKTHLTKGFFSGGYTGSVVVVTADRTTYSTETTAAVTGANLSQARRGQGAAGNAEKGFFSGGDTGSYVVTADRTTYSTETTAAVSGADLSQSRGYLAAAGNAEKGFFAGGRTGSYLATADRTTYSTETAAAVSGANLSQSRGFLAAAGNAEKGFFSGGYKGSTPGVATADRTTYSTETTAAVSGANLSQARYRLAAAGNAEKGFFTGGDTGSNVATADRTTYSTETTAAVSGANLSQARYGLAAAGNAEKGFFSGGYTGSAVATADRTTYSTETTAAVSGANLSQARRNQGAI